MKINAAAVRKCLKAFDFATLFREHLGWDNHHARLDIAVGDVVYNLTAVAQKRGFVAFLCPVIPDRPMRLKVDHKVTKSVREHFVIYTDQAGGRQVWHWVRREPGKPVASRNHRFHTAQSGDPLIQRLDQIAVSMEEEEAVTVVDVVGRVKAALDVDKITKKFYDRFKAEHAAFLKLIKGIQSDTDLAWYTSLMLNRLMFVYFIQKKGFLDGDPDYLNNRLAMVQELRGKDKFQTFYRYFLLRLFHDGLGKSPDERKLDPAMRKLLGQVPFLDGGFFEVHQLEEQNPDIDIPDKAFEKLFAFFDRYRWHLDERPLRADNEINPDVVGYIFEKYINQKQMGAYYTKEDITEYISKNTLIPFLFDAAEKKCPIAFKPNGFLWRLLSEDPDRYLYPAVKHGVIRKDGEIVPETELPDFVQTGMHAPKARMHDKRYNLQQAPAGDALRLVTETWREYIQRRTRCLEIREKLSKGEVHQINNLITLNLDIWQFARDAIVTSEGPELLRAFWHAIELVTVLDPTCGSGAFLFAALRILETLYSDCLERMGRFIEEMDGKPHHPKQFSDFKKVLAQIGKHPGERYFILKSIIINNLYGVDIMAEAVEICKLRLFLKLVAQVERVEQIEPLPDMDFNIRAGNTLVGYATEEQARKAFTEEAAGKQKQGKLMFGETTDAYRRFEEDLLIVEKAFQQFRAQQTTHGGRITHKDKQELRNRLEKLDDELDRYLASEYGVDTRNGTRMKAEGGRMKSGKACSDSAFIPHPSSFEKWKAGHQPFHWFVEFYGIMNRGGFDVIIGNPPYVEYSKVKREYALLPEFFPFAANLYSACIYRINQIKTESGYASFIVPVSLPSTDRMQDLRQTLLTGHSIHFTSFSTRPSKLFEGAEQRLTIFVQSPLRFGQKSKLFSGGYLMWSAAERTALFPTIQYVAVELIATRRNIWPKLNGKHGADIFARLRGHNTLVMSGLLGHGEKLYYKNTGLRYFNTVTLRPPRCWINGKPTASSRETILNVCRDAKHILHCYLLSSTFFFHYQATSNCRDLNPSDINEVPMPKVPKPFQAFNILSRNIEDDYTKKGRVICMNNKLTGEVRLESVTPARSKPLIDKIDSLFAKYVGFSPDELDYVMNYHIKYRMGRDAGNGGAE